MRPAPPVSLPLTCLAAPTAVRCEGRSIPNVVIDALLQPIEAMHTVRSLLEALGGPRGWSWAGLWQQSAATQGWRCDAQWYASDGASARNADALSRLGDDDVHALNEMLQAHAVAHLIELRTLPRGPRTAAALCAGHELALRVPLRASDRMVGVLEWLGGAGTARASELLAQAELLSHTVGLLLDHHRVTIELQQFKQVVDALPDMVYLVDREQMRFSCQRHGLPQCELHVRRVHTAGPARCDADPARGDRALV